MAGDYKKFGFTPKAVSEGSSIGSGEIDFQHLSPALFSAIRNVQLHTHSGNGSVRLKLQDIIGYFPSTGFLMYSTDGTKKFLITITNTGIIQSTEVT